jgi:PTS system nitrogen regulatory IIA component
VYRLLVYRICHHHKLPTCGKELLDMILKRDEEAPTAYPSGIAIPHIRLDGFQDTVVAMAFLQNPLDYEGRQISWVVLIITDISSSKLYLNMVAALLGLSKNPEAMRNLASCADGHAAFHLLKQMNVEIKKDITIADIMIREPVKIHPEERLRQLGALYSEHGFSMIPVVDENDRYLGEINILNFLRVGVPDYLMMMDNLNFLLSFEPLERLFEKLDEVRAREIMSTDEKYLLPEASVIEAVFEMIQRQKRYICVVDKGRLVGVVTAMDIFRKVIQA